MKRVLQVVAINREYSRVVEVFKTSVSDVTEASSIVTHLHEQFPLCKITFDLDDCDRILRVEGTAGDVDVNSVLEIVKAHHYDIEIIPD
jgi:hypothetical protein